MEDYPVNTILSDEEEIISDDDECLHLNKRDDVNDVYCIDCGMHILTRADFNPEWRFYGAKDSRRRKNPSRIHHRRREVKSIKNDVKGMGFAPDIVNSADMLYTQVTEDKIYRGKNRKAIIFACIFNAYIEHGRPQCADKLNALFHLPRKALSGGFRIYTRAMRDSKKQKVYVGPCNLIPNIMRELNATSKHIDRVTRLYTRLHEKMDAVDGDDARAEIVRKITTSNPQSVAAGVVFYYCTLIGKEVNKDEFGEITHLSPATITKMTKNIITIYED